MATTAENGIAVPKPANDENAAPDIASAQTKLGDTVTVFHDPNNFNVKHPLMHEWTLWFTKPPSGKVILYTVLFSETIGCTVLIMLRSGRQLERAPERGRDI